jgi:uncharacterized protein YbjT (DUF2867 family)
MDKPLDLMVVGATGVVGSQVLAAALVDSRFAKVIAPTRRPLPSHDKLLNPVVDFTQLPTDAPWWRVDAVICALGTTIKAAGSQAAFAAVDRELPIRIARLAKQAGATRFALNSALGASQTGNFYLRTKAEAETGIRAIGYPYFTIVRPSLIDARRKHRVSASSSLSNFNPDTRASHQRAHRINDSLTRIFFTADTVFCLVAEVP